MSKLSRLLAFCLALMYIMMIPAAADAPFLVHSAAWQLDGTPVDATLSADVRAHMPFDEDRLASLTAITGLLSLRLVTWRQGGSVTINLAGEPLLTLSQNANQAQLSSIPGVTYTADGNPLDALLGEAVTVRGVNLFGVTARAETLLDDGWAMMAAFPEAFAACGRRTSGKTTVSGMGTAAYRMDYAVPGDDVQQMKETLLSICPEGWLREIIGGLTFSGKQTLRAYYTETGVMLRMEYTGACGPEGDLRNANLIWRMRRDDKAHKDEITLRTPAKTGKDKNNLTFTRVIETEQSGAIRMTGEFAYTVTRDGASDVRKGDWDLVNAFTGSADVITGHINLRHLPAGDNKYDQIEFEPDLIFSGTQDAPLLSGTLLVRELWGKGVREEALITVDLKRADASPWQENALAVNLSALSPEELSRVRAQAASSVSTALVRPLILLMGGDAAWFFQDMPNEQVQIIIDAAQAATN